MYDILDSEWDSLTLTNNPPSRSNSMHKITKKDSKPSPKSELNKNKNTNSEFDDLLNSVLNKDTKLHQNRSNNTINSSHRLQIDTLDSNHEDIRFSHNNNKNSTQHPSAFQRTSFGINFSSKDFEDHGISHHFGSTQKSIFNPSKINQSVVSTRNMRPPLKPKDNLHTQSFNFADETASVIPEEDPALTNSSHNRSNSFKRRSSIDSRSELTDDVLPLRNKPFAGGTVHSVNFDTIKEDVFSNINKSESCVVGEFKSEIEQGNIGNNFFKAKDKLQIKSESLKVGLEHQIKQSPTSYSPPHKQMKQIVAEYEKQLQALKSTYQKQITHLQQCLNAQLQQNRNLRQTLMQESNKLLEQERTRTHQIHQQEISRLKEIFLWQQKKQEETYTHQIQSLKASLDLVNGHQNWMQANQKPVEQNIEFMQVQLQSKEQRLDSKMKLVEQREIQLDRKESELNIKMRREEERVRSEEKRLTQMEFEFKKMMMEEKKYLSEQKQELALELGSMESDFHKRKEQLQLRQKQLQFEFQSLEQQKRSLQSINCQAMSKHRASMQQLQRQKERVKDLQIELIQKLRVVETRAKELALQVNNHEDWLPCRKQNNWLDHSYTKSNNHQSTEKKLNNSNSMSNMAKTKERFDLLERNSKSKLNLSKESKKIDLSNYISRIENNMNNRQP